MAESGLVRFSILVPWGSVDIVRPTPKDGDPWGSLAPLRGTPWGDLIPVIPGEVLTHALRGHTMPLERVLGLPPEELMRRVPLKLGRCELSQDNSCPLAKSWCRPCKKLPDCYEPPGSKEESVAAAMVALSWKEGRYVIIPDEGEFAL